MAFSTSEQPDLDQAVTLMADVFVALVGIGIRGRAVFSNILKESLVSNPAMFAAWTVWEPDAVDGRDADFKNSPGHDETGRFVTCWHRASGEARLVPVVGYDNPMDGHWYWTPKRCLTKCRLEPIDYRFGSIHVRISSRIAPLVHEGRFFGVVGIDTDAPSIRPADKGTLPVARAKTTPLAATRLEVLSPREREVYHWLRSGKSNEEIGIILGISHHTVKNHIERIFQKLGVHNRYEAMLVAP